MKIHVNPSIRRAPTPGWTLVELMTASGLSTLLIALVVTLGMFTSKSFYLLGNYEFLDYQNLNAADVMSREIRDASALVSFSTNNPVQLIFTNAAAGYSATFTYYTTNSTLVFAKTGLPSQTLLKNCNNWSFQLFDRSPRITSTNITFYAATNSSGTLASSFCKVVDMSWTCSRIMLGTTHSTESVQTAQVVLRNQINN
jgi:Tfp pilus assembly protein PilW